ncbi:NAD-binding protein, partial [Streptomyces asiaticus]
MVICGDDALAHRLAAELHDVYRARVTLVIPGGAPLAEPRGQRMAGSRAATFFGRFSAVVGRVPLPRLTADDGAPDGGVRVMEAPTLDEDVLTEAGVEHATALALVHDDDEANIHAALRARRLNPRLRLVIRLYNRKLGQHLEELLDQAARVADPGMDPAQLDAATTVLSDADTAAPALAATAVAGTSKVVQADGLLLRA